MSKLEEASHDMLVLMLPRVSSRVSVFLWLRRVYGGSCKTSPFRVVMSFCVAGVALCDIPACLITCRKCQNCMEEASHEMLVLLRPRVLSRVSGFPVASPCSCQTSPFRRFPSRFPSRLSCRFAWQAWHFKTSQPVCDIPTLYSTLYSLYFTLHTLHSTLHTLHFTLHTLHFTRSTLPTPHFTLHTPYFTLHTPHFTLHTLYFTLHTPYFTLRTPHSTRYTFHFTLHTLHSTLYTPHSTLYTLHSTL